jgi:hypothetical protein
VKPAKGRPKGGLAEISQREDFPEIMREYKAKEGGGKGDRHRMGVSIDEWEDRWERWFRKENSDGREGK